jgi:hypothetical protein
MQIIYVSMATVATIGHYGIYVALPQGPVDVPGIADVPLCYVTLCYITLATPPTYPILKSGHPVLGWGHNT